MAQPASEAAKTGDDNLRSDYWYLVDRLRPRLAPHAVFHRQKFRGVVWYVLQDPISGQFLRLSAPAYVLVSRFDGRATVDEIWEDAAARLKDDLPPQYEVLNLMAQLFHAGLLHGDVPANLAAMGDMLARNRRRLAWQKVRNPLGIRFSIFDPDRFLSATAHIVNPIFSRAGALVWLAVVLLGLSVAAQNFGPLTENLSDRVLSQDNLLMIALLYPLIKAVHELGHGYAVKRWGGKVHEIGIMLIVFFPIPYVDATASWSFRDKRKRALVAAMGVIVELFIAAIAILVWQSAESGLVRAIAFNTALTAGVSTLIFNGNPLLRFDGYYVLADLLEVPNLGPRSTRYLQYLMRRYVLGNDNAPNPALSPDEERIFLLYGIGSLIYRLTVMIGILLFVAGQYFFIGVLLALWAGAQMFALPLIKGVLFLFRSPALVGSRERVLFRAAWVAALAFALLFIVPLPSAERLEGVTWAPERARLLAGAEGIVAEVLAEPGSVVSEGDAILRLDDPFIAARIRVLQSEASEMRQRYSALRTFDRVEASVVRERLQFTLAELGREKEKRAQLVVRAPFAGDLILPGAEDLVGRFVRKGDTLAYVMENGPPVIRVMIDQAIYDRVSPALEALEVRFVHDMGTVYQARLVRRAPTATRELPSLALSVEGGGTFALDPSSPDSPKTLEPAFAIDLELVDAPSTPYLGQRAYVRAFVGWEPLATRLYRQLRLVFLRRFDV